MGGKNLVVTFIQIISGTLKVASWWNQVISNGCPLSESSVLPCYGYTNPEQPSPQIRTCAGSCSVRWPPAFKGLRPWTAAQAKNSRRVLGTFWTSYSLFGIRGTYDSHPAPCQCPSEERKLPTPALDGPGSLECVKAIPSHLLQTAGTPGQTSTLTFSNSQIQSPVVLSFISSFVDSYFHPLIQQTFTEQLQEASTALTAEHKNTNML